MFQQGVHIIPTCSEIILGEAKKEKPNMDWNANIFRTVAPFDYRTTETQTQTQTTCSFTGFLCNPNYHPFPGNQSLEARHDTSLEMVFPAPKTSLDRRMMTMSSYASQEKKRRITVDQLESLESSFQEEIKLDPDRKMKLARELGLQPRQVAVWFQNRRARWRAKKLEHLYVVLKHEYDAVTREKQKLHEEVQRLKCMLTRRQLCSSYNTEPSCEESVESIHSYNVNQVQAQGISNSTLEGSSGTGGGGAGLFNVHHDYDLVSPTYWGAFPSSYPSE